jgi:hypothetical protein
MWWFVAGRRISVCLLALAAVWASGSCAVLLWLASAPTRAAQSPERASEYLTGVSSASSGTGQQQAPGCCAQPCLTSCAWLHA